MSMSALPQSDRAAATTSCKQSIVAFKRLFARLALNVGCPQGITLRAFFCHVASARGADGANRASGGRGRSAANVRQAILQAGIDFMRPFEYNDANDVFRHRDTDIRRKP